MPDFDSPVSIANEHTRAAMSDAARDRLAKGALDLLRVKGIAVPEAARDLVYALVNGLRVLGAINVGIADLGLELGALVRTTALAGLVQAQGAADTDAISPSVLEDLQAIAAEDDDSDDDTEGGGADPIDTAAAVLADLDDAGRDQIADALRNFDLDRQAYADILHDHLNDPGDDDE